MMTNIREKGKSVEDFPVEARTFHVRMIPIRLMQIVVHKNNIKNGDYSFFRKHQFNRNGESMNKKIFRRLPVIALVFAAMMGLHLNSVSAADLSGEWKITINFLFGTGQHSAVIKQNSDELSGVYKGEFKEGTLRGKIDGNRIEFTGFLHHEASSMVFHYTGTVSGNAMSGTVEMGEYWSATWKAVKTP